MTTNETDSSKKTFWMFLLVLLLFFGSGATGLLYQVIWTRKLALLFGVDSYALSTTLSIFFLGLGIGSLWGGRLADRTTRPLFLYGIFEFIIGIWAVGFILIISNGESLFVAALKSIGPASSFAIPLRAILATIMLIVPVVLMGATLPLLGRFVLLSASTRGLRIGTLYSLNTFGAIAGCLMAGFYLIPDFGYTKATWAGAIINFLIGAVALLLAKVPVSANTVTDSEDDESESEDEVVSSMVMAVVIAAFRDFRILHVVAGSGLDSIADHDFPRDHVRIYNDVGVDADGDRVGEYRRGMENRHMETPSQQVWNDSINIGGQ